MIKLVMMLMHNFATHPKTTNIGFWLAGSQALSLRARAARLTLAAHHILTDKAVRRTDAAAGFCDESEHGTHVRQRNERALCWMCNPGLCTGLERV